MDGAGQVTPVGGLSDNDCRLIMVDSVTLPIAETVPDAERFKRVILVFDKKMVAYMEGGES